VKISSYEDLLKAANAQSEPQRLLFVFTQAEKATQHKGSSLTPVMCVDKLASEQISFATLAEESRHTGKTWDIVFMACMSSKSDDPESEEAEQPLNAMVKSILVGNIGNYLAFDRDGKMVKLVAS